MARKKSLLTNVLVLIVTIILFFAAIEIALRVTGVDSGLPRTPPIYQKSEDSKLSYELKPNLKMEAFRTTVTTDRRGFRSADVHPGKGTIALLGDSLTFGYGLKDDETVAAELSRLLGENYNVVAAAAPGYDLRQETALYKEKVALLHPGTVVVLFYWNDLGSGLPDILDDEGNLHAHDWTPDTPQCNPIRTGVLSYIPGSCWLDLHSALYRTVKKIVSARTEQMNLAAQQEEARAQPLMDPVTEEQLASYAKDLDALVSQLPKSTHKLFVIWPEKQLHLKTSSTLALLAQRRGFETVNLYEVFGNKAETLSWDTVHPSAQTTKEAANVIFGMLKEEKLLPSENP